LNGVGSVEKVVVLRIFYVLFFVSGPVGSLTRDLVRPSLMWYAVAYGLNPLTERMRSMGSKPDGPIIFFLTFFSAILLPQIGFYTVEV